MLQLSHVIYEKGFASITCRIALDVSSECDETLDSKFEVAHLLFLRAEAYGHVISTVLVWLILAPNRAQEHTSGNEMEENEVLHSTDNKGEIHFIRV